jgi:thiamine monophosphate kinase
MEIDVEKVPRMPGVSPVDALSSGEEYEIVVTAPSIDVKQFTEEFGLTLTEVGVVVAGSPGVSLVGGGKQINPPEGFDHFREK